MIRPAIAFAIVTVAACSPTPSTPPPASTAPVLDGHWVSACTASPQADGSTQYVKLDAILGKTDWKLDYVVHGDAACSARLVTITIDGDYALDRPSPTLEGAWEARFGFAHKSITPHVDGLVAALTGAKCGAKPWKVGEAQDVFDAGCAAFGQYPKASCGADYDLVGVVGGKLHFGERPKDNDMCVAAKRPAALAQIALGRP
ncbi:hypothetical protein BH09MYX1_BH09MYX1_39420 [soil metagenome]